MCRLNTDASISLNSPTEEGRKDTGHTHRCSSPFRPRKAYGDIDAILLFSINLGKKATNRFRMESDRI